MSASAQRPGLLSFTSDGAATVCSLKVADACASLLTFSPYPTITKIISAAIAIDGTTPRFGNGLVSDASAEPISAPSRPPAKPATIAQIRPSGMSDDGHGSGIQTWLQAHSAAKPM